MSNLILKEVLIEDIKICSELFYDVFTSSEWNFEWLTKDKAYNYFMDMFNTPNFQGFLLIDKDKAVGGCVGIGNPHFVNNQFEIKEIFINPALQKKGLGTLFLNKVENRLMDMDYQVITLYTQRKIPAFKLYKNENYSELSDTTHMIKVL